MQLRCVALTKLTAFALPGAGQTQCKHLPAALVRPAAAAANEAVMAAAATHHAAEIAQKSHTSLFFNARTDLISRRLVLGYCQSDSNLPSLFDRDRVIVCSGDQRQRSQMLPRRGDLALFFSIVPPPSVACSPLGSFSPGTGGGCLLLEGEAQARSWCLGSEGAKELERALLATEQPLSTPTHNHHENRQKETQPRQEPLSQSQHSLSLL